MFRQLERLQSLDLSHCPHLREVQTAAFHNNLDLRLVIKGLSNDTFFTVFLTRFLTDSYARYECILAWFKIYSPVSCDSPSLNSEPQHAGGIDSRCNKYRVVNVITTPRNYA
jgi:hypothetical protein